MIRLTPPRLRGPFIAGAIAMAASGCLLYFPYADRLAAEAALRQENARFATARAQRLEARQIDTETRDALIQLDALRAAGYLTPPDRQGWHSHLLALQARNELDRLDWEISPPHPLDAENTPSAPEHPHSHLVAATLKLHGEVPHEGHLLKLLERPPAAGRSLFSARHCHLARTDDSALAIDCEIDWISLRLPAPSP